MRVPLLKVMWKGSMISTAMESEVGTRDQRDQRPAPLAEKEQHGDAA